MITIYDFYGKATASTLEQLETALRLRDEQYKANSFETSLDQTTYPYISAFMRNGIAVLYFFVEEGGDFFTSQNELAATFEGEIEFAENKNGAMVHIAKNAAIEEDFAIEAIKQFSLDGKQSSCIKWLLL
jgi:hypothetical protein